MSYFEFCVQKIVHGLCSNGRRKYVLFAATDSPVWWSWVRSMDACLAMTQVLLATSLVVAPGSIHSTKPLLGVIVNTTAEMFEDRLRD